MVKAARRSKSSSRRSGVKRRSSLSKSRGSPSPKKKKVEPVDHGGKSKVAYPPKKKPEPKQVFDSKTYTRQEVYGGALTRPLDDIGLNVYHLYDMREKMKTATHAPPTTDTLTRKSLAAAMGMSEEEFANFARYV